MTSRLALYGVVSTLGAASVIGSALHTRANFYAAAVAVGRSSGALMVLANFALFNTICFGIMVKTIFFGRLRSIEYEHLFERLWLFLTESLLALTIFRDDFSAPFAVMYGILLFLKCFHWITADRVDYMDQIPHPGPPTMFHIRCSLIIVILTLTDCALVLYSLESILVDGVSAMVLFASEFMILLGSIGGTSARYIVGLIDLRRARGREDAPSWEEKSMYLFYVDLAVDFVKLLTYLSFFLVILLNYGLPLHILRDVYMTLRSFLSRCSDLVRYRRATRDMDSLYPNATMEEMERNGDRTCIICREEMIPLQAEANVGTEGRGAAAGAGITGGPNETPKKLQCGHIFHFHCLRSWLERQQSCPTCRRDVLRTPATRARPGGLNGVNVQINPPPPAPGAVPRAANAVPGGANPNPIQAVYDQYFRHPQPAGPQPTAPPTTAPPRTEAGGASGSASRQIDRDQAVQRGIWGGAIAPGRFFGTPLGAAPAWPPSGSSSGSNQAMYNRASSSRLHVPLTTIGRVAEVEQGRNPTPTMSTTPVNSDSIAESSSRPSSTIPFESSSTPAPSGPNVSITAPVSGTHTPFTSNPPQIFSPAASSTEADQHDNEETDQPRVEEGDARKAAAEAALRRMGLGSRTPILSSPLVPSETDDQRLEMRGRSAKQSTRTDPPILSSDKGKGKAQAEVNPLEEEPTAIPYLTLPGSDLLSLSASLGRQGSVGLSREGTDRAIEERLRVLREVDEVVWGLVGELTRVQSGWSGAEHDGGSQVRTETEHGELETGGGS